MVNNELYKKIKKYFPLEYKDNLLCKYLSHCFEIISQKIKTPDVARILGSDGKSKFKKLVKKYSSISDAGEAAETVLENIVEDLFSGIPRWRSPNLQYNVGTGVNTVALVAYILAMEENIYAINDGLAGNSLVAEEAVSKILADLAGVRTKARGFFTFGGTATNLYAKKLGIKKSIPESSKTGVPKGAMAMITRDAHFSHDVSLDWVGIAKDNIVIIESTYDRRSSLEDAEHKMRKIFESGQMLTSIAVNGGTTYNHIIDDIKGFVDLRDRLSREYSLNYRPHLHVDSVIGWSWLVFNGYDFQSNPLRINRRALKMIEEQYKRISPIYLADSWGVDFHKGIGSCPIDCSIFMVNDEKDFNYLSKKGNVDIHHVAQEFSFTSPVDFTLETSRSSGPALAALVSLQTLGLDGYRRNLANLIEQTLFMRNLFNNHQDVQICHEDYSLGFVTMLRFYPLEYMEEPKRKTELSNPSTETKDFSEYINKYMKAFFSWDNDTRMKEGMGVEYSFSSGYITLLNETKVSGAKLYPVSPHFSEEYAKNAVETIMNQKRIFDKRIWNKK